jgi:hypothetical protein
MTAVSTATSWAETDVIRRLETEWQTIANSRHMQRCLRVWGAEDPRLAFEDGHQLVKAAQRREASSWAERDKVLSALLDRFEDDPVAKRIALQIVLPQVKSLIRGLRGWDTEERAARVVATAIDVLAYCATEPAGTPPSFRVFSNTRRRVLRAAIRDRSEPLVPTADLSHLEDPASHSTDGPCEEQEVEQLVEWVRQRGRIREEAARLVVMTRAAGVTVDELAAAEDVDPQTLRQRRLRAERRLRQSLSLAR